MCALASLVALRENVYTRFGLALNSAFLTLILLFTDELSIGLSITIPFHEGVCGEDPYSMSKMSLIYCVAMSGWRVLDAKVQHVERGRLEF